MIEDGTHEKSLEPPAAPLTEGARVDADPFEVPNNDPIPLEVAQHLSLGEICTHWMRLEPDAQKWAYGHTATLPYPSDNE